MREKITSVLNGLNLHKKALMMAAALILVAALSTGITLAYFSDKTGTVTNNFEAATVVPEIVETVSGGVKSSVTIKNNGTAPGYFRAVIIGNTVDDQGNITGACDVSGMVGATGWVRGTDGYWYYTLPVEAGESTGELLTGSIVLTEKQVTVLAEGIQCEPAQALTDAHWGWTPQD